MNIKIMKLSKLFLATLTLMTLAATQLFSQKPAEWKGGFPGHETDWNCPQNWTGNTVPNAFSDVSVPDVSTASRALPIIKTGIVEINSIRINAASTVFIGKGCGLLVFGWCQMVNPESIRAEGIFKVLDEAVLTNADIAKL